jgi:hypothetical protein
LVFGSQLALLMNEIPCDRNTGNAVLVVEMTM